MEIIKRKPTIVCIRQLGGCGDVLSLSCIYRGIHESFPDHKIINVTTDIYLSGALVEIGRHNPFIDEIVKINPNEAVSAITKKEWGEFNGAADIMDELILQRAEYVFDCNVACIVRENAEIQKYGTVKTPRYKIWCDAARIYPSTYEPIYSIEPFEQEQADRALQRHYQSELWINDPPFLRGISTSGIPIVGLGLASANPKADGRSISIEKLEEIALQLKSAGICVVTIDATRKIEGIPALVGRRLQELMPLIKRMSALVTVDSGLLHMAGVVKTPVIGLFGSSDPNMRMGYYRGSAIDSTKLGCNQAPCWYRKPCLDKRNVQDRMLCMKKIEPSIVVNETLRWTRYIQCEANGLELPEIK